MQMKRFQWHLLKETHLLCTYDTKLGKMEQIAKKLSSKKSFIYETLSPLLLKDTLTRLNFYSNDRNFMEMRYLCYSIKESPFNKKEICWIEFPFELDVFVCPYFDKRIMCS